MCDIFANKIMHPKIHSAFTELSLAQDTLTASQQKNKGLLDNRPLLVENGAVDKVQGSFTALYSVTERTRTCLSVDDRD